MRRFAVVVLMAAFAVGVVACGAAAGSSVPAGCVVRAAAVPGAAESKLPVEPLCSPQLVESGAHPLRVPADLVHHTLLTMEAPSSMPPTMDWEPWQALMGLPEVRMKNTLRFTLYTDAVNAAVAGQGVVIGRLPLLDAFLRDGRLVAPFGQSASTRRGHYIETSRRAAGNPDAQDFVRWLRAEADAARG